jgi:myo-inositol 2-dehydrogenase/D-chiro-inositol 1-dehydrogenase
MRIGIIGTHWGLMHVGAFRAAGAEVVALCGQNEAKTRDIARREGIPLAMTEVAALCAAVDVVVVAGPDRWHAAHIHQALDAGRHVLSEKPLTRTALESRALLAREKTLPPTQRCAVSFSYRMLPPVAALERWLRQQPPARHLTVTVLNSFAAAEGWANEGPLLGESGDFAGVSHLLDTALWLLGGRPLWVNATLMGRPVHTTTLEVGLSTGAQLTLQQLPAAEPGIHGRWSILGPGDTWQARFAGGYVPERGGWCIGPAEVYEGGVWSEIGPLVEPLAGQREPWAEAHVATARTFLGLLRGEERGSLARFADGARVQEVLEAAMRSEQEGRRIPCEPGE